MPNLSEATENNDAWLKCQVCVCEFCFLFQLNRNRIYAIFHLILLIERKFYIILGLLSFP